MRIALALEDTYVLKREGRDVEARSPDTYDLSGDGGSSYGCYGYPYGTGEQGDEDSDTYVLKRQVPGLDLASGFGAGAGLGSTGSSGLGGSSSGSTTDMTSESTSSSTDTSLDGTTASSFGTGSGLDFDNILSGFGANAGANGNLASSFGV